MITAESLAKRYPSLASYDAHNLEVRIKHLAAGKSDPKALAAKLLEFKKTRKVEDNSPADEKLWCQAILLKLPKAAPTPAPTPAKAADPVSTKDVK